MVYIVTDTAVIGAVQQHLHANPSFSYLQDLVHTSLAQLPIFLYGGALRNLLLTHFHRYPITDTDYDLIIDDTIKPVSLFPALQGRGTWKETRARSLMWKPTKDLRIELIPLSRIHQGRLREMEQASLEVMLQTTNFTVNSVAYDLHKGMLYDHAALKSIRQQEIELLYTAATPAPFWMAQLVLHAQELKLTIGPAARQFVRETYSPDLDSEVRKYMYFRKKPERIPIVVEHLRALACLSP